jgi:hypothetical protein
LCGLCKSQTTKHSPSSEVHPTIGAGVCTNYAQPTASKALLTFSMQVISVVIDDLGKQATSIDAKSHFFQSTTTTITPSSFEAKV